MMLKGNASSWLSVGNEARVLCTTGSFKHEVLVCAIKGVTLPHLL